jgi:hypothetical protein
MEIIDRFGGGGNGGGGVGREGPYDRGGEIRGRAVPRTGQDSARRGLYA